MMGKLTKAQIEALEKYGVRQELYTEYAPAEETEAVIQLSLLGLLEVHNASYTGTGRFRITESGREALSKAKEGKE